MDKLGGRFHLLELCIDRRLQWTASDIVNCARAAEARRMWIPFSTLHEHKKTAAERQNAICTLEGGQMFADLPKFDFPALLGMLVEHASQPRVVETLAKAIELRLAAQGAL